MEELMKSNGVPSNKNRILVFRSNIDTNENAVFVCNILLKREGIYEVTIDLEDWENILRLESHPCFSIQKIEKIIFNLGFKCSELH